MPLNCDAGEDSYSLDTKEIKSANPKENHPIIGRTDAESPDFGHLMGSPDSLKKTLHAGKD